MEVNNKFNIEQLVYLKTDVEQAARMVKSFQVFKNKIVYQLVFSTNDSWHEEFEITAEPAQLKTKDVAVNGFGAKASY